MAQRAPSSGAQARKDACHIFIRTSAKTIKDNKESQENGNLAATNFSFFINQVYHVQLLNPLQSMHYQNPIARVAIDEADWYLFENLLDHKYKST